MAPFYRWGSIVSRLQSHYEESLFFTTQFPGIPGTHLINLKRTKGWVDLRTTQGFWNWDPWIPLDWKSSPLTTKPLPHLTINHLTLDLTQYGSFLVHSQPKHSLHNFLSLVVLWLHAKNPKYLMSKFLRSSDLGQT